MKSTGTIEVGRWLGERLPVSTSRIRAAANERLPAHLKTWWFALGGTVGYLFVLQLITGVLLAIYYETAPGRAYESVRYITHEAAFGWYLRSVHKWGATLMIAALILHQVRVFFTGAYRKPREINWIVGMCLLICTLMVGFTGYSLVYEQLSFWGATVGANIAERVPLVGSFIKSMLLGGDAYNSRTLSRFFVLHAAVLPFLMVVLIAIHLAIVRIQGVAELDSQRKYHRSVASYELFPHHFHTELLIGLSLMVILSALACIFPATMGPAANPEVTPDEIKPEWFFFVAFRWLKLFTGTAAVLSMGFIVLLMFAWPFVDAQIRRRTRFREASVWIGLAGVLAIVGLTLWEAISEY